LDYIRSKVDLMMRKPLLSSTKDADNPS